MAFDLDDDELKATKKMNGTYNRIKEIEQLIDIFRDSPNIDKYSAAITGKEILEIEYLLKSYIDLKEIEESHRKENGELREKVKELEERLDETLNANLALAQGNANSIPVSLIKEKIEELKRVINKYEKQIENDEETDLSYEEIRNYASKLESYEELLEKR